MQRTLGHLLHLCPGDGRPDCPILDDLGHPDTTRSGTKLYKPATPGEQGRNTRGTH
jgi:MerR family copper efflux transcriptional regulator